MTELVVTTVKGDPAIRDRLRKEFKRLDLSVEEVAEMSGIAKGTLDNIMSGRTESMKDVHLSQLCQAFPGLDIVYVLTGNRPTNQQLLDELTIIQSASKRALDQLGSAQ